MNDTYNNPIKAIPGFSIVKVRVECIQKLNPLLSVKYFSRWLAKWLRFAAFSQ